MLARLLYINNAQITIGSLLVDFPLCMLKAIILFSIMRRIPGDCNVWRNTFLFELIFRDLTVFLMNTYAYTKASYFSYTISFILLVLQTYDRTMVLLVRVRSQDTLKALYFVFFFSSLAYVAAVLVYYRNFSYIKAFHDFGPDTRLYSKCKLVI
ncbi:hypothetical protein PAPHI01_0512 [Pancytospora philotis]|nr:hypothetical protein PAPHI01_0512 [Pancytospora philotis]